MTAHGPALILSGTVISDSAACPDAVVAVLDDRIVYAGPRSGFDASALPDAEEMELPAGSSILPGLVDLHCHGAAGGDFPAGDDGGSRAAVDFLHRSGTTTLLASLVTASPEDLLRGVRTLRRLADEALIAGIHSEGPFLSHARCGAQNADWLRDPDPELLGLLLQEAGGWLKTMTYAPELPGADELVRLLIGNGVTPSLGHTDADASVAAASLEAAAAGLALWERERAARPTVTHLFNGMPPMHHRKPGPLASCLRLAGAGTVAVEPGVGLALQETPDRFGYVDARAAEKVVHLYLLAVSIPRPVRPDARGTVTPAALAATANGGGTGRGNSSRALSEPVLNGAWRGRGPCMRLD